MNEQEKLNKIEYYSQRLFNKSSKDIKYLYVSHYLHNRLIKEQYNGTGLYNWIQTFNGDCCWAKDCPDYSKYDIVQINLSGQDLHLVHQVRDKITNNNTKLVVNNDYTSEIWKDSFEFPELIKSALDKADMVFGTEHYQTTALSLISHKNIYMIPHPANIDLLKSRPQPNKIPVVSTIWRRYDKNYYVPNLAVRDLGLKTHLLGYNGQEDHNQFKVIAMYNHVNSACDSDTFLNQLASSYIVYNPFTFHSIDRSGIDCAAMGVAVVGSNRTQSMRKCYPFTICDPWDVLRARQLMQRLIEDKEFYNMVVEYAKQASEFYNQTNAKYRYLRALYLEKYGLDSDKSLTDKETISSADTETNNSGMVAGLMDDFGVSVVERATITSNIEDIINAFNINTTDIYKYSYNNEELEEFIAPEDGKYGK